MSAADLTALTLVTPLSQTWSHGAARAVCCKLRAVPNQRSRSSPQGAEPSQGHKPTFQQEKRVSKYPGRGTFLGAGVPVCPAVGGGGRWGENGGGPHSSPEGQHGGRQALLAGWRTGGLGQGGGTGGGGCSGV